MIVDEEGRPFFHRGFAPDWLTPESFAHIPTLLLSHVLGDPALKAKASGTRVGGTLHAS